MQGVNSLGPKFLPVCPSLPNPTVVVFNNGIEVITKIKRIICFFCEESSHGRQKKHKHLPRINTELHGNKNKQKQKISEGKSIP